MEEFKTAISLLALLVAAASFITAQRSAIHARKVEAIKELLGDKESVAFAAIRLLRDGLPEDKSERALVMDAIMQACVFEGSDRSRALLYRVLYKNRPKYDQEISDAFNSIHEIFKSMNYFQFSREELNLERGQRRLEVVAKVLGKNLRG